MENTIKNENGQVRSMTGNGVMAFRYRCLYLALKFKRDTGMHLPGGQHCIKIARQESGLRTRNLDVLMSWALTKQDEYAATCEITG